MATIEKLTFIRVVMGRDMLRDFHLIKKALVLVVSVAISGFSRSFDGLSKCENDA